VDLGGSEQKKLHSKQNQKKKRLAQKRQLLVQREEGARFSLFTLILALRHFLSIVQYYELLFKKTNS